MPEPERAIDDAEMFEASERWANGETCKACRELERLDAAVYGESRAIGDRWATAARSAGNGYIGEWTERIDRTEHAELSDRYELAGDGEAYEACTRPRAMRAIGESE